MKGFLTGLAITFPLTMLLLYVVLTQKQEVNIKQQKTEKTLQIESEKFDIEWGRFDKEFFGHDFDEKEHRKTIDKLASEIENIDEQSSNINEIEKTTIQDIRKAMEETQ